LGSSRASEADSPSTLVPPGDERTRPTVRILAPPPLQTWSGDGNDQPHANGTGRSRGARSHPRLRRGRGPGGPGRCADPQGHARQMFKDRIPVSTWIGLAIILAGSMVIHLGRAT
jgi:hypothetical protein